MRNLIGSVRWSQVIGVFLIGLGLAANAWTLEWFVLPYGDAVSSKQWVAIALFQMLVVVPGLFLVCKAPRLSLPSRTDVLVLLGSSVLCLGAAELALRFIVLPTWLTSEMAYVGQYENRPSRNFEADAETGWRMRKNHEFKWRIEGERKSYRSNAQGFRSDRDFHDSPGKMLIAMTGDSFTWGTGVDHAETFANLVESRVSDGVVFNYSMPGFGLDQMWMSVRHQILPAKPKLVIVAFIDADLERSLTAYRKVEGFNKPRFVVGRNRTLRPQTSMDAPSPFVRYLRSKSRLWNAVSGTFPRLRPFGEWWVLNTAIFEAIALECKNGEVPLLIVRIPEGPTPRRFASLVQFMHDRGISYLDLGTTAIPKGIHFEKDGHINSAGHEFVASAIAGWIKTELPRLATEVPTRRR